MSRSRFSLFISPGKGGGGGGVGGLVPSRDLSGPALLTSVAVFSFLPSVGLLCSFDVLHLSDSETTEDETTEPQVETKEGSGRHQDKAGWRRASGNAAKAHR